MIISYRRHFSFIHVPKCAGKAFREVVQPFHDHPVTFWDIQKAPKLNILLDFAHLRCWEVDILFPDVIAFLNGCRSLAFIRNPAERYVSAVYEHFSQHRPEVGLAYMPFADQRDVIRDFTRSFRLEASLGDRRYVHFSPQRWFTHLYERQVVRHLLPLTAEGNTLSAGLALLEIPDREPAQGSARQLDPDAILGADLLAKVRSLYAIDYDLCESLDHLRPLALH